VFVAGTVLLAGCKTDALTNNPRPSSRDDAPTTSLENPAGQKLPTIAVADRTEVDLVEQLVEHRAMYARYLRVLAQFYTENGSIEKAKWARNELTDLQRVKPYAYILDAEASVSTMRPMESIAEADQLYAEGHQLMKKGGHGVPVFYNQETMKLAMAKFKQLIDEYPTSDKIAEAAFYIAEIHKEYFEEKDNRIALEWYQRAIDWDPDIQLPARFQMAVVYDYRMHEREKALEMYQEVVEKEHFIKSNLDWSNRRIGQLTREITREASGEPLPEDRPTPEVTDEPISEAEVAGPAPTHVP
jgi:tetratricopeptide (TPR) repeat protein